MSRYLIDDIVRIHKVAGDRDVTITSVQIDGDFLQRIDRRSAYIGRDRNPRNGMLRSTIFTDNEVLEVIGGPRFPLNEAIQEERRAFTEQGDATGSLHRALSLQDLDDMWERSSARRATIDWNIPIPTPTPTPTPEDEVRPTNPFEREIQFNDAVFDVFEQPRADREVTITTTLPTNTVEEATIPNQEQEQETVSGMTHNTRGRRNIAGMVFDDAIVDRANWRENRTMILFFEHAMSMSVTSDHYNPQLGMTSAVGAFMLRDGLVLYPVSLSGGSYQFMDGAGRQWYNQHSNRDIDWNSMPSGNIKIDFVNQLWCLAGHEIRRPNRASSSLINEPRGKKKLKKKLRRARPLPELKLEKHYAGKDYIA